MQEIVHNINLNLSQPNNFEYIHVMQGDYNTEKVIATLFDGNKLYTIDAQKASLQGSTSDGGLILQDGITISADKHQVTFDITKEMSSCTGELTCNIVFSSDNQKKSTFPFVIKNTADITGRTPVSVLTTISDYVDRAEKAAKDSETNKVTTDENVIKATEQATIATNKATESDNSAQEAAKQANIALTKAEESATSAQKSKEQADISTIKAKEASDSATASADSATQAGKSATIASEKASDASSSANSASASATNASKSETNAKTSADLASLSATNASTSETNAQSSATASSKSAQASATSEANAKQYATNAKTSETSASKYASDASISASTASKKADIATTKATESVNSASDSLTYSNQSKNYRDQCKSIAQGLEGALFPKGTITFSNLPTSNISTGDMYNISDDFTSDNRFKDGAGKTYTSGTNIYYTSDGLWDVLIGDLEKYAFKTDLEDHIRNKENPHGVTKSQVGLGNVDNTSDTNKPVSTAQQTAIDAAYTNANKYTDKKVAELIGSAPETMDTLEEVAVAIQENKDVETALNAAIGTKANQSELDTHTDNSTIHITTSERTKWNAAKTHADSTHARTDATKVEKSTTNGNIKINGTETTVYTHPSGTNPHGTTKSDVGLGNVGNYKAVSTVASQGLSDTEKSNARANIGAGTSSFSGSYNDLSNKPTIPTVGNGTITIKQAGTSKGTFTMNQSGNTTIELTDNNTTYGVATSSALGLVKSGTDITVDSSGNVSVNDDSHNHVISNVDGLQSALDGKLESNTSGGIASCGGDGKYSYFKIATIKITDTYVNRPIVFEMSGRGRGLSLVTIMFSSTNSTDPTLSFFTSNCDKYFWINKTTTSTWEVYGQYNEQWGSYTIHRITGAGANIGVTVNMTNIDSLPSGCTQVAYGGNVNHADSSSSATKATQDESGNNIKASYASSISISDHTITLKNKNGTSLGTVTVPDTNTWRPLGTTADTACAGNDSRLSNARPASDVYAWAKASSKPSYSWSEITSKPSTFTPASHTHSYLPLSGGTISGALKVSSKLATPEIHGSSNQKAHVKITSYNATQGEWYPSTTGVWSNGISDNKWYAVWSLAFNGASDRKLKTDIKNIDVNFADSFIDGLKPSAYKFKDNMYGKTHTGFIAQDVEDLILSLGMKRTDFAGLVKVRKKTDEERANCGSFEEINYDPDDFEGDDENYDYSLRYDDFIAPLVAYCQNLKKKNTDLEDKYNELTSTVNEILKKLN